MSSGVAVVTGGSRGVGKTTVKALSGMGYLVYTCARNEAELVKTAREVKNARIKCLDLMNYGATQEWIDQILIESAYIDVLVNNAGVMAAVGPLVELDMDEWEMVFRRNLFSMVRICHRVIPVMIKNKGGCIINIAGGGSAYPRKNFTAYACSKAAVVRLSDTLAEELQDFNIRVNAVAPGMQESAIWRHALKAGEKPPRESSDNPEDLARLIKYIVSTPSLTGKFLHIKDDYRGIDEKIMISELYTLKRINP